MEHSKARPHTSWVNILAVIAAGLGSFNFGYANNVIAGSFGEPTFIEKFLSGPDASARTDGIIGGFLGGAIIGSVVQSLISSAWGRRAATGVAAFLFILGNSLDAGAGHISMFIVGRVIAGVAGGMTISNCPVYMSEISPPHTRGLLVGLQGVCIVWAYIICSALALGFSFVTYEYQWRLNYIVHVAFSVLLLVSIFFLPESPRWLAEQGRFEEAAAILQRLHKTKSDPNGRIANAEMVQIKAQVELEQHLPRGYLHILKSPSLRKRFICTALVWTMGQSTGINVIATLTPTLFASLGFDTTLQLGLSVVWTTKGLTLEEIAGKFDDTVPITLQDAIIADVTEAPKHDHTK
ncbi:hypothetical protein Plec18170_005298 [Paecilomyces lecythidis]